MANSAARGKLGALLITVYETSYIIHQIIKFVN